jgi:hypothetical protein
MLLHSFIKSKHKRSNSSFFYKNIILVTVFALLYYLDSVYYKYHISLLDCFYYSLVTQTTVGFGDIIPKDNGYMKHLTILQLLFILAILSSH